MAAVNDLLTCAICLDWFTSPRRLPCHHVYCLECLRGLVKPEKYFITCPECRRDHVMQTKKVEEFQVDGRLEQFIKKQSKQKLDLNEDINLDSDLISCEHSQPMCRYCQTINRAKIIASFLSESRQFHADFLTETPIRTRQTKKSELVNQKTRLQALRTRVVREIKVMMNELEKRQLTLLSEIEAQEKTILEKLSQLDQTDEICAQYKTVMADFVDNIPETETIVSLRVLLSEQKKLMTSLYDVGQDKGTFNMDFNSEKIVDMIASYGKVFFTNIDYRKDFTLLSTIDGSESSIAFEHPWGLTVCPITDNVYVTDATSIRTYSSDGQLIIRDVTNEGPSGLAIDSNQRLILASHSRNKVYIYNPDLQLIKSFGSCGDEHGQLNWPLGVACDDVNNIYVIDSNNKRVQVFTPQGTFLSEIGRDILQLPCCVQINKRQEILVTDSELGQVVTFSGESRLLKRIIGAGNNKLKEPFGICLDESGRILVADHANKVIQVYNDDGTYHSTISQPAEAMSSMCGLAVTKSGVIFLTDYNNHKIHRIGPLLR